ncbi:MAG: hypothetical protein E7262_05345 [Lachnospiraceae bacterium]|nr:hypothetical protein [Lachnospiraceae bacterium]
MSEKDKKIMLFKELKIEIRRTWYIISFVLCNLIVFGCVAYYFNMIFRSESTGYSADYKAVLGMYNTVLLIEYIIILCVIPFTVGVTLAREYEAKTLDLLLISKFSTKDIIHTKLKMICIVYLMLIVSTLPYLCVVFSVGVINIFNIIVYVLVVMSSVICYSCIGMYISAKVKKVTLSALLLAVVELASTLGSYVLFGAIYNFADGINKSILDVYSYTKLDHMGNLLVTNPVINIFKIQSYIEGNASIYRTLMNNYGVWGIIDALWIPISILFQLIVAWIMYNKTKRLMLKKHHK